MAGNIVLCVTGAAMAILGLASLILGFSISPYGDVGKVITCVVSGLVLIVLGCVMIFGLGGLRLCFKA